MIEGIKSRKILAEEKSLPRDSASILIGAEPFSYPVEGERAVILIHGFGGTPFDLRLLGKYLSDNGIAAYGVLLPGFGTSELDLEKTNWKQWSAGAEQVLDTLTARYKKVYLVGFSMGGAIVLHLAAKHNVAGVILLAPCIYINGQNMLITPEYAIKHLAQFMATDYIINDKMRAFDFSAMRDRPYYHLFPIKSLKELVGLEETARGELGAVEEPVLIIQSVNDHTVDKSGPSYLVSHLPRTAEVFWVERSMHLLALDAERDRVFKKTRDFILHH